MCEGGINKLSVSKPIEFDGIKLRFMYLPPYTQKFYSVSISKPVLDDRIASLRILYFAISVRYNLHHPINTT